MRIYTSFDQVAYATPIHHSIHRYIHIDHIARYGLKDDKFSLVYTKTYNWVSFVSLL